MKILIKKRKHQNQDIAKSQENQFFNYFLIRIFYSKKQPPKPRYCQKFGKSIFQLLFN